MFSGIIIGVGKVIKIIKKYKIYTYIIKFPKNLLFKLEIGASVANNGCCLTVVKINFDLVFFDVLIHTFNYTNLKFLKINSLINLERSLKFGDEIGGHLISGHVMTTAKKFKNSIIDNLNNNIIWFKINNNFMKYLFPQGFICINGVSLTINNIKNNTFSVNLIPQTMYCTNLQFLNTMNIVNIEIDIYTKIIIDQIFINTKF